MAGARFGGTASWTSSQVAVRSVGAALARWGDPRRRLLRKRRAALRITAALGGVTSACAAATVGVAVLDAPSLLVAAGCGVSMMVAAPTAGAAIRLRHLHKLPLPAQRPVPATLPPRCSAAHAPLRRLGTAESSLRQLVGLLDAHVAVPSGEVQEVSSAAASAAAVLRSEAADLVVLEHARDSSALAAEELLAVVRQAAVRLDTGVREYEQVVAGAARAVAMTSSARTAPGPPLQDTIDRIDGLTQALAELAGSTRR